VRRALRKIPLQAADVEAAGAPVAFWRDFTGHADPGDEFWAGADHEHADLTRLPPVSMVTGWWDLFLPWQLRDFAAIQVPRAAAAARWPSAAGRAGAARRVGSPARRRLSSARRR